MGIFGFLSKAHLEQNLAEDTVTQRIEIINGKIESEKTYIKRQNAVIERAEKNLNRSTTSNTDAINIEKESLKDEFIKELEEQAIEETPETYAMPKLPEGITEEMVQENPMYSWWQETAKTNGMNQEEYEAGINAYVEMMQSQQPDIEKEMEALGENANSRIYAVNAWASKNFPPEEYEAIQYSLGASASGIQALERIMEMNKTGVRSEQFTQPEKQLTMADARAMMQDKRYYDPKYRDDAYVAKVDAAFRMLTK